MDEFLPEQWISGAGGKARTEVRMTLAGSVLSEWGQARPPDSVSNCSSIWGCVRKAGAPSLDGGIYMCLLEKGAIGGLRALVYD